MEDRRVILDFRAPAVPRMILLEPLADSVVNVDLSGSAFPRQLFRIVGFEPDLRTGPFVGVQLHSIYGVPHPASYIVQHLLNLVIYTRSSPP